jgi:hypothetical protein
VQAAAAATENGGGIAAVVLSPWETNALMPVFSAGGTVATLHLFAPRTCLTTRSVEDLLLYAMPALPTGWRAPRVLVQTLLLLAGQVYLRTYHDYVDMCQLLGAPCRADDEGGEWRTGDEETGVFGPSAIPFFLGLLGQIRHPSVDISNTDIGHILTGRVLPPSAFSGPLRAR